MPDGFTRTVRPGRLTAVAVLVSLLTSLTALTGAAPARADDPQCAPLALAPFGDPGDGAVAASVPADGTVCYTVTTEAPGLHLVSLGDGSSELNAQITASDGTEADCYDNVYAVNGWCDLPAADTYTLTLRNQGWSTAETTVSVVPLRSVRGCAERTGTAWDEPDAVRTTVSPVEVDCQPFDAAPGERIRLTYGTQVYGSSRAWITDATGDRICPRFPEDGEDGSCVLPAGSTGPYRVISQVTHTDQGFPAAYQVKPRRLNDPQGCTAAPVRPYGVLAEQDLTLDPCHTFTAGRAGRYTVHLIGEDRGTGPVAVYDAAGKTVCTTGSDPCRVPAAGTYTAILDGAYPFRDTRQGLVVLDRASSAGCEETELGLHRGELSTVGQYDCLTLPVPQGARVAALTPSGSSGVATEVEAVDADGTVQCDRSALSGGTCALTGTAPYRVLIHTEDEGDGATGPYALALYRTDAASGCPALPAGSFAADGALAAFGTGDGVFADCLSIPADAHTGAEVLQLRTTSGSVPARYSVLDSTGKQVCSRAATTDGWSVCALTPGKEHTVLVSGQDKAASYTLARRDVTASAESAGCAGSAATAVGGPSVKGAYAAAGILKCHRITTGAATDVLHLNVRDAAGSANTIVLDAAGKSVCPFANRGCAATGSTSYQVLVQTPVGLQAAPEYHLDALRIATADGPAPECAKVPSIAYGYGPLTGTLDEAHTAVCAALPTAGFDRFTAGIEDPTGAGDKAVPALYNAATWKDGCVLSLPDGYRCAVQGSSPAAAPTVLVLGLPEKASSTAYSARLTCSDTPCGPDRVSVAGVGPTTGVTGTKVKVTVTGTALGPDTAVRIRLAGKTVSATADSVAPDNRSVTSTLDLTGAAPGTWTVSVVAHSTEYLLGTVFTVTEQPRLRNTAAPRITGTARTGAKVTAAPGSWSATGASYTYQWKAGGTAISGATSASYTVPATLVGKALTVTVTAAESGFTSASATSPAVTVAKGDAPKATRAPVISGTAKVGRTLKTSAGSWSPAAASYAYQWYANGKAVTGATKSSLVLKQAQKGKRITVKVTARRAGCKDGSATSAATRTVIG
ncbi:Tat pathway signal protein [Streptomyces sp. NPDC005573]|uniref:Tat pathway signal protein n=1 Tax=Streptomyces sp. NPDC005573 TaxID=3156890 RepID=UPI0033AF4785